MVLNEDEQQEWAVEEKDDGRRHEKCLYHRWKKIMWIESINIQTVQTWWKRYLYSQVSNCILGKCQAKEDVTIIAHFTKLFSENKGKTEKCKNKLAFNIGYTPVLCRESVKQKYSLLSDDVLSNRFKIESSMRNSRLIASICI